MSQRSKDPTSQAPIRLDAPDLAKARPPDMHNFSAEFYIFKPQSSPFSTLAVLMLLRKRGRHLAQVRAPHPHKHLAKTVGTTTTDRDTWKRLPASKHQLIMFPNNPLALKNSGFKRDVSELLPFGNPKRPLALSRSVPLGVPRSRVACPLPYRPVFFHRFFACLNFPQNLFLQHALGPL